MANFVIKGVILVASVLFQALQSGKHSSANVDVPGVNPGTPLPFGYGTARFPGTCIWSDKIMKTGGGKGKGLGGGQSPPKFFVSCAFSLGEQSYRVKRIWGDTKLLYDRGSGHGTVYEKVSDGSTLRENFVETVHVSDPDLAAKGWLISESVTSKKRYKLLTVYYGSEEQMPDSTIEGVVGAGNVEAYRGTTYIVFDTLMLADFANRIPTITAEVQRSENPDDTVTYVITDLCTRAGMDPTDYSIDCSIAHQPVHGYVIADSTTPRDIITNLQLIYNFDAAEVGYKVMFRPRNRRSDALVFKSDIATTDDPTKAADIENWVRTQDYELPKETTLKFNDMDRDYTPSMVRNRRLLSNSQITSDFDIPICAHASEMKTAIDEAAGRVYLERVNIDWQLPFKYSLLDAGDIIGMLNDDGTLDPIRYRISTAEGGANGLQKWTVQPAMYQDFIPQATADSGTIDTNEPPVIGDTVDTLMDTSLIQDGDNDSFGFYGALGGTGPDWAAGALFCDITSSNDYEQIARSGNNACMGVTHNALFDSDGTIIDRKSVLTVEITTQGEFTSIPEDQLYFSKNAIAVQNSRGEWELMKFANAVPNTDGTWDLFTFMRCRRGTEFAGTGHATGCKFVLLTEDSTLDITQEQALNNVALDYKPAGVGDILMNIDPESFTNSNNRLKPYSVCNVKSSQDLIGDWVVTWNRRARKFGGWQSTIDVPLDEPSELYQVEVYSSSAFTTLVNTYSSTSPSWTYGIDQQVFDFGSYRTELHLKIYQMSSRVGRGQPKTVNLSVDDPTFAPSKRYWGASNLTSLTPTQVKALGGSEYAGDFLKTVTYNCSGGKYPYFAFPQAFGIPTHVIVNNLPFSDFSTTGATIDGVSYYVIRFNNLQHGASIPTIWA